MAREEKNNPDSECTNIKEVVVKSLDILLGPINNPEVTIEQNYLHEPVVDAPENVVVILVSNILRKPFRYTLKGSISITLNNNSLIVKDTGIGIRNDDLENVFKRGFRGEQSIGDGSGLG